LKTCDILEYQQISPKLRCVDDNPTLPKLLIS